MDVVGDGGDLVLRASSSSVESPGFLAAYSAHVIRPPSAVQHNGDDGAGDRDRGACIDDAESEAASEERWAGTGALDPAAQAIRSLQASQAQQSTCRVQAEQMQGTLKRLSRQRSQSEVMSRTREPNDKR